MLALYFASAGATFAEKVILRVRAGNPIDKPQKVQIRQPLPSRVSTNHILNLGGLELGYDVNTDTYFVHKSVELGPKDTAVYDVELMDIWNIPAEVTDSLKQRAKLLASSLKEKKDYADADRLRVAVEQSADLIQSSQQQNSIGAGAQPIQHIRAYEANLEQLGRTKKDIGKLENLVIANGGDPGSLVAQDVPVSGAARAVDIPPAEYKTAVVRITVQNTSPTAKRSNIFIRRELPPEIQIQDILDAGGLDVGKDPQTGNAYVYRTGVEINPKQTLAFEVKIRDKWNVHAGRIKQLQVTAEGLQKIFAAAKKFKSIEDMLALLVKDLKSIEGEKGPAELNDEYVAFYREQGRRLDEISQKIDRIKSLQQPSRKQTIGFDTKPPSHKTTWLVIWAILGFLALVTIVVVIRAGGRARGGRAEPGAPPPEAG